MMTTNDNGYSRKMYERSYGEKYDANLSTTDIAKRFRADVKDAIKAGKLPKGLKLSVRTSYYAGGSSIRVYVQAAPFRVMNPEAVIASIERPMAYERASRHTAEAMALTSQLEKMLAAYNHDGSEAQVDYFDVNFYGFVDIDHDLEHAEREEIRAEHEANRDWTPPWSSEVR